MEDNKSSTIYEKYINSSPEPLSIKATETILEQMKKCVCKIYNGSQGSGFFIKIPYKKTILPVIITNEHIIPEKDIINNVMITIYVNNETKGKNIKIGEDRLFYSNKELDVTIIEIKEKDAIQDFLELDDRIKECLTMNNEEISFFLKNLYSTKSIYILNYPEEKEVVVSYGPSPKIKAKKIEHKCNTNHGSSGSPILLSHNQKVIGIHYGHKYFNEGTLIIYPIIEFNKNANKLNIIKSQDSRYTNDLNKAVDGLKKSQDNYSIDCEILEFEYLDEHYLTKNDIKLDNKIFDDINNLCGQLFFEHDEKNYESLIKTFLKKYYRENIYERIKDSFVKITTKNGFFFIALICQMPNIFFPDLKNFIYLIPNKEAFIIFDNNPEVEIKEIKILISGYKIHIYSHYINKKFVINNKIIILKQEFNQSFFDSKDFLIGDKNQYDNNNIPSSKKPNEIFLLKKVCYNDINKKCCKFDLLTSLGKYHLIYRQKNELDINKYEYEKKYYYIPKKELLIKLKLKLILNNPIHDLSKMFVNDENLVYVDISQLNTENVTNMSEMFYFCQNLKEINLTSLNTKNVTDMSHMFCGCYCLKKIDVSSFDTKNVRNMSRMFMHCKNLEIIDLSNFDTKKVTDMASMFKYCRSLKGIYLSSFNTENVLNMNNLFLWCDRLHYLDLSSFNFQNERNILMLNEIYALRIKKGFEKLFGKNSHSYLYTRPLIEI